MAKLNQTGVLPPQGALSIQDAMKFNANNGMNFSEPDANGFVYPNNDFMEGDASMNTLAALSNDRAGTEPVSMENVMRTQADYPTYPGINQANPQATLQVAQQKQIPGLNELIEKNRIARLGMAGS